MASEKQISASRRNAKLPRGPLSETARESVSRNPIKHGLTAKHIVLNLRFAGNPGEAACP